MSHKQFYERPETESMDLVMEEGFCGPSQQDTDTTVSDPWDKENEEEAW